MFVFTWRSKAPEWMLSYMRKLQQLKIKYFLVFAFSSNTWRYFPSSCRKSIYKNLYTTGCTETSSESVPCNNGANNLGRYLPWGLWSACSASCGTGSRTRTQVRCCNFILPVLWALLTNNINFIPRTLLHNIKNTLALKQSTKITVWR